MRKSERNELKVRVRLNHVTSNQRGPYSTLTVEDCASGLQILEVELGVQEVYDILANRGSGYECAPALMPVQTALDWIGQQSWHFSRKLDWKYKADDPKVKQWAAKLRDELGLHTSSVTAHNDGAKARWTVYSNSITDETYGQYDAVIQGAELPPESKR